MKVVREHSDSVLPVKADTHSAGFDLYSIDNVDLEPMERSVVSTGLRVEIDKGYVGLVCPRSGLALKYGVTVLNGPGIIDSSFRGELKVIMVNFGESSYSIGKGDRIAQLVLTPYQFISGIREVSELSETERNDGGFGSSGR